MKLNVVLLFLLLLGLLFPPDGLAHGGFSKKTGNITVYVLQDPISPLVGEQVRMFFTLRDESVTVEKDLSEQNLVNWPVTISVIDTFYGDASRDKIILVKELRTDVNGNFNFEYIFDKENYFDIELDFKDKAGANQEIGFLIQPRKVPANLENQQIIAYSVFGLLIGLGLVVVKPRFFRKIASRYK